MIDLQNNSDCTGCSACEQICPQQCITLTADKEGFLYPRVSKSDCINCGLCEKRCSVIAAKKSTAKADTSGIKAYAAKNISNEVRDNSSSGGVFSLLAESVIKHAGVVFGASFSPATEWAVQHTFTETLQGIKQFRGSKYVQSDMGDCFSKVKEFLDDGREVLFSGTPCQVSGLSLFLNKEYPKLLLVDCICMGVPSPKVWEQYIGARAQDANAPATAVSFRDKQRGWDNYSLVMQFNNGTSYTKTHKKDLYMRGFSKLLFIRPSCHACVFKEFKGSADITLGDYWGVSTKFEDFDDNRGVSLVLTNTKKGEAAYQVISKNLISMHSDLKHAADTHRSLVQPIAASNKRAAFFHRFGLGKDGIDKILSNYAHETTVEFTRRAIGFVLRKMRLRR